MHCPSADFVQLPANPGSKSPQLLCSEMHVCNISLQMRAGVPHQSSHRVNAPNEIVKIQWSAKHRFERALDWYAAFIGSGFGAFMSLIFLVIWLGVGNLMRWGDNWWLIIGTWTGVVGTFNSAVLRYSLYNEEQRSSREYDILTEQDKAIFKEVGLPCPETPMSDFQPDLMARISISISRICATRWAVLAVLTLILGLLVGATVVLWDETVQLLVNSVTMIVDSFFLIVLVKAHNIQATDHRIRLHDLLKRRLQLLAIHRKIEMHEAASHMHGAACSSLTGVDSDQGSKASIIQVDGEYE
jgi:low-affinity ferrous iron transport protein